MIINISIDTQDTLTDYEKLVLGALAGTGGSTSNAEALASVAMAQSTQALAEVAQKPAPAKAEKAPEKAEKAPEKAEKAKKAEPAAPKEEKAEEEKKTTTPEEAVKRATVLVQAKKTADVKAALSTLGVKKVSELGTATQRNKFMEILQDA